MDNLWDRIIAEPLARLWEQTLNYLPTLFEAALVLLVGVLLALIVKEVVWRGLRLLRFDRLADRLGAAPVLDRVGLYRGSSYAAGQLAEGFVLLVTMLLVLNALGPAGSELVMRFFLYLPNLLIAAVILVVGGVAAGFFGRGALIAAVNARLESARLLAGAVRAFIWLLTIIVVLEQVGIGRTTVMITFGVLFGGLVTAVAVAFGLAGKELAREALTSLLKKREREEEEEGVHHL
ncbi:MAG TPA: hypothetical protein VNN18_10320 [Candidatus Xenobia bacterium]|nr:hypothetical protein [Candidatus Xenobia bacterium]